MLFALPWVWPTAHTHAGQKTIGSACSLQGKKSGSDEPFGHIGFFVGWRSNIAAIFYRLARWEFNKENEEEKALRAFFKLIQNYDFRE